MTSSHVPVISLARDDWRTCVQLRAAFEESGFVQVVDRKVDRNNCQEIKP